MHASLEYLYETGTLLVLSGCREACIYGAIRADAGSCILLTASCRCRDGVDATAILCPLTRRQSLPPGQGDP